MGVCLSMSIWLSWFYVGYFLDPASDLGKFWPKFIYCGVTFIVVTIFHYEVELFNLNRYRWLVKINYVYGLIMCALILKTDLIVAGIYFYSWGIYPKGGPWLLFYHVSYFIIIALFFIFPIKILLDHQSPLKSKSYAKYILMAIGILTIATVDFLPNYGIDLYPIGYIQATIFTLILAYAIIKHRFMDIHVVIKKGIVYTILISFITVIYLVAVVISERIFKNILGYENLPGSLLVVITIAIIFTPLRNLIQDLVDKVFFKGTPAQIAEENALLRRELARSDRYKTLASLIDSITHEMKGPLTALIGYHHALPQKLDDPQFLSKFSEIFKKEITKITELIQNLSNYSQPAPLSLQKTNIIKLINDTLDMLKDKFIHCKVNVYKYYDEKFAFDINIDPQQIRQALLNILLNALEAMPEPEGGQIWIGAEPQGHEFHISISDTGCGIAPEHLTRIFDPFFKLKEGNRGLGLSVVQNIIESHGGRIDVESEVDGGTEFFIKLPIA